MKQVLTAPIFGGIYSSQEEALKSLVGDSPLSAFTYMEEVSQFSDGDDIFSDQAVCFGSIDKEKEYASRRVKMREAKIRNL